MHVQKQLFTEKQTDAQTFHHPIDDHKKLTCEKLLSAQDIQENGMFYLRCFLGKYRDKADAKYWHALQGEIKFKLGKNNLKNILRDIYLKSIDFGS